MRPAKLFCGCARLISSSRIRGMSENVSPPELLASPPPEQLAEFLKRTSDRELEAIEHDWGWWGRPNQQAPKGDWRTWLLLAGRGFGKTRSGAECIRDQVIHHRRRRIALVAPTAADARDVMVEGESGLLAIGPPQQRPQYEPTKRRLTWPNGAIATTYSADEPERLRGPQHDAAWCDEIASWRYPEAWDMLCSGCGLGLIRASSSPPRRSRSRSSASCSPTRRRSSLEGRATRTVPTSPTHSLRRLSGNTKEHGSAGKRSMPKFSTMCR